MWYRFNHFKSLDQGAKNPLGKVRQVAVIADTRAVFGSSHANDYVLAPVDPEMQALVEGLMAEDHLWFEKVEKLPEYLSHLEEPQESAHTETGRRMAASTPNLQQVSLNSPEAARVKAAFIGVVQNR